MSVDLEHGSGEGSREVRHVRLQDTPEYIPMLNHGMLHQFGCNTPPVGARKPKKTKRDSDVSSDKTDTIEKERTDAESEVTTSELNSEYKGMNLSTTAKVIVQARKAANRAKSKVRQKSVKKLLKQASMDSEIFKNYNLTDMHRKIKRQKQLRIAFLQKQFLDELPVLAEKSVKEHLAKRIEILENLKQQSFISDTEKVQLEQMEQYERPNSRILTRRQSRLRKSLDFSYLSLNFLGETGTSSIMPTKEDIQKLLAVAKSREKIEDDLDLPLDRMQRLSTLRQNVDRINNKFRSLNRKKMNMKKEVEEDKEKEKFYAPSRFTKIGMVCLFL